MKNLTYKRTVNKVKDQVNTTVLHCTDQIRSNQIKSSVIYSTSDNREVGRKEGMCVVQYSAVQCSAVG